MINIRELARTAKTKPYTFMGEEVTLRKLSITEVIKLQGLVEEVQSDDNKDKVKGNLEVLIHTLQTGIVEMKEVPEDDFMECPLDDLTKASQAIMTFSGMAGDEMGNE